MKTLCYFLTAALISAAGVATAVPVIDGSINPGEYALSLGTSDPATSNYGAYGLFSLVADQDASNIYIGVRATPEVNFNSLILVVGNQNSLAGIPAGTQLPNGGGGGGLGNLDLTVGFEADYVFRITTGNTNEAYVNALNYVGHTSGSAPQEFLGGGPNTNAGTLISAPTGTYSGVQTAFRRSPGDYTTNTTEGWEIALPKALLNAGNGNQIRVAVLYGNSDTNNFSNQQIPAGTSTTTSGGGAVISAVGGSSMTMGWTMYE